MQTFQRILRLLDHTLSGSPPPSLQSMGVDQEDNPVMVRTDVSAFNLEKKFIKNFRCNSTLGKAKEAVKGVGGNILSKKFLS